MINIENAKNILLEIHSILEKNNFPFFLMLGTCLGAVREKGIISYDKDIDLGFILENNFNKITNLEKDFVKSGYEVSLKYYPMPYARAIQLNKNGVHVDISGLIKNGDEMFSPSSRLDYALVYPKDIFENQLSIDLFGKSWQIPSLKFLELQYGANWEIPDFDWKPRKSPARKNKYLPFRENIRPLGITIGCFDLLHPGHLDFLKIAKSHCAKLMVGIVNDQLFFELKGHLPIHNENARKEMLSAVNYVDEVHILSSLNYIGWLIPWEPDVVILSDDHKAERFKIIETKYKIIRMGRSDKDSTSAIIKRCGEL